HDRYLLERITDQQYAILDGHFRHLPGGVDQYLRLRKEQDSPAASNPSSAGHSKTSTLSSAELRNTKKEIASIDRKMEKLSARIDEIHTEMAQHDPTDGAGLAALSTEVSRLEAQVSGHETRWIELSELVDA
ncbi:MAG: transporter ATP-binding protein, partial [Aeromicrobium sp.]|nr:transporter ATP-binding protein [Aeromicrobium sp.]